MPVAIHVAASAKPTLSSSPALSDLRDPTSDLPGTLERGEDFFGELLWARSL